MIVNQIATHIIESFWPSIASDLGECDVMDLVDTYIQEVRWGESIQSIEEVIEYRDRIIIKIRELNYGNDVITP